MKRSVRAAGRTIEYTLSYSTRKSLLIKALPNGQTRVYAPKYASLAEADRAVRENADQILSMHAQLSEALKAQTRQYGDGDTLIVEGAPYRLRIQKGAANLVLSGDEALLYAPNPQLAESVRSALKTALVALALKRIRQRLDERAPAVGGEYHRVTIREQRTRWGSCSSKGNLNFNWLLIFVPPEALDYVVVHELCHLLELNHSERFWALVRAQMPDYEVWKRWLRQHGQELAQLGATFSGASAS